MWSEGYQKFLILLLVVSLVLLGIFCYKELFPQYKLFQDRYVVLEEFRSTYTGEEPVAFGKGVKQIVIPGKDNGPETIDRCTSCHVALKLQHFSPTKLARDLSLIHI